MPWQMGQIEAVAIVAEKLQRLRLEATGGSGLVSGIRLGDWYYGPTGRPLVFSLLIGGTEIHARLYIYFQRRSHSTQGIGPLDQIAYTTPLLDTINKLVRRQIIMQGSCATIPGIIVVKND
jgi:hypothetical protein